MKTWFGNLLLGQHIRQVFFPRNISVARNGCPATAPGRDQWSNVPDQHLAECMEILMDSYPITDPWDWHIYHIWLVFMVNVSKYTIHGSYGYGFLMFAFIFHPSPWSDRRILFRLDPLLLKLAISQWIMIQKQRPRGKRRSLVEDLGEMARRATPANTSKVLAIQQHPATIVMIFLQKLF